jgi:hypothetical protein
MNSAKDNNNQSESKHAQKRPYNPPTLSNYGTVVQKTLTSGMGPINDAGMNMMARS